MPAVVLQSPVMDMHSPALASLARLPLNGQIHTPPGSDHSRNDISAPPPSSPSLVTAVQRVAPAQYTLDPALKERSPDNIDPALSPSNGSLSAPAKPPCANCGAFSTPLWRRDGEGKAVCNACGESTLATFLLRDGRAH